MFNGYFDSSTFLFVVSYGVNHFVYAITMIHSVNGTDFNCFEYT